MSDGWCGGIGRGMRRGLVLLAAVVLAVLSGLAVVPASAPAGAEAPPPIEELLARLNGERTERGLAPLTLREDVSEIAGRHSIAMSSEQGLRHNDDWFTPATKSRVGARAVGENVAYAGSVADAHAELMASAEHRAIILDPRWTVVGLGAVDDGSLWWVTQDFLQPR